VVHQIPLLITRSIRVVKSYLYWSTMSMDQARIRRKSPIDRAAELQSAARDIALEDGLRAISLRAIAKRVGVTPALVSHYEPSMESLVARTFGEIVASEIVEASERIGVCESAVEKLSVFLDWMLDDERKDVTVIWTDAWSLGRGSQLLAIEVRTRMDEWFDLLAQLIRTGCATGELTAEDPDLVAYQLLGMIDGLNAHALVNYGATVSLGNMVRTLAEHELGLEPGTLA
jgi:AcrR family transcriptional regulator